MACKQQMAGGGDRKEFGEAFDQAEHDHLPQCHWLLPRRSCGYPSSCAFWPPLPDRSAASRVRAGIWRWLWRDGNAILVGGSRPDERMTETLKQRLMGEARAAGFDVARVTTPTAIDALVSQRL